MADLRLIAVLGDELYSACKNGDLHKARDLSTFHLSQNSPNDHFLSSMMAAAASGDRADTVENCLFQGGIVSHDVMSLILICRAVKTYELLLTYKAVDPDYFIPWFGDILGNVARNGDLEWTKLCLENGANPNANKIEFFAAEGGRIEAVKLLLKYGAWLEGSGAIVLAAESGQEQMVRYLLEQGADIEEFGMEDETDERETSEMGTALHKAALGGHEVVVRLLLDKGAEIDAEDIQGRTPLALAREDGHENVIRLLEARSSENRIENN